jgi:hypothetical protein
MWNTKCSVIQVIIGATEIVDKGLKIYLETIPGKHSMDSLQKIAVLGASNIMRELGSLSGGVYHGKGNL